MGAKGNPRARVVGWAGEAAWGRLCAGGAFAAPGDGGAAGAVEGLTALVAAERDAALALAATGQLAGVVSPITRFGAESLQAQVLPGLASGAALAAYAAREAGAVGDPVGRATRARRSGGAWVLDGVKRAVPLAEIADWFVVDAVVAPEQGWAGLGLFVIPRGAAGLRVGAAEGLEGLRGAGLATVHFDGVRLDENARLVDPAGAPGGAARWTRRATRLATLTPWLPLLEALLAEVLAAGRAHSVLGRRAVAFQTVRAGLVDLRLQLRLAALLHAQALPALDASPQDDDADRRVASAALLLGRAVRDLPHAASRLAGLELGPAGERLVSDARAAALLLDPDEALRAVIATGLFAVTSSLGGEE